MASKKINHVKFLKSIALAVIILGALTFGIARSVKIVSKKKEISKAEKVIYTTDSHSTLRDSIVDYGMKYLGKPYMTGASCEEGFDCSGFVYFVYKHFKISVPRSSIQFKSFGKEIPIDSVQKGDILVFLSPTKDVIGHVGIVTNPKGMESDFIHATSGSEMKVVITSLKQKGYTKRFVKAVDVL